MEKITFDVNMFLMIMLFYIFLSYIVGPIVGYYVLGKTAKGAGNGFVAGSVLSIILWYTVGQKMVK
jgi:hypothetical protein